MRETLRPGIIHTALVLHVLLFVCSNMATVRTSLDRRLNKKKNPQDWIASFKILSSYSSLCLV